MKHTNKESELKIGVYGRTAAGKTRFLYELLHHWETDRCFLSRTPTCNEFLQRASSQIEKHGGTKATEPTASQEGISVSVQRPDDDRPVGFTFRDLRGELLEGEIDNLESLKRDGLIPQQVAQCDAFLFFFDPTSWERPTQLAKHHARELRRAEMFIEYVLSTRQNKFLPIVFVVTRLDEWEEDETIGQLTEDWLRKAHERLQGRYETHLAPHFPTILVDKDHTCCRISALRSGSLNGVVEKATTLVEECDKFRRKDRRRTLYIGAAAAVFLVIVCFVGGFLLVQEGASDPISGNSSGSGADRVTIGEQTETDIAKHLEEIEKLLSVHPRDPELVTEDDAKAMNGHLKWLMLTATTQGVQMDESTRGELSQTIDTIASAISRQASQADGDYEQAVLIIGEYLDGVADASSFSEPLSKSQQEYWTLARSAVSHELGGIMARRHRLGSSSQECLKDIIETLKTQEVEVEQANVFGPSPRKNLLEAIRTAQDFCEDRSKTGAYGVTMRIVLARLQGDGLLMLAPHAITIQSSGMAPVDFSLTPSRVDESNVHFSSKSTSFDLEVGIGDSLLCTVSSYDRTEKTWSEKERFELIQGDVGPFSAIGMPLLRTNRSDVTKQLQKNGYQIKLEFSKFPSVPRLLWEAAEYSSLGEGE